MSKKIKSKDEHAKSKRTFPVDNTVLLIIVIAVQIGLIVIGISYQPKPQDLIHQYNVVVAPLSDGSLDIEYKLVWEALDTSEKLTWVEIGMPNDSYTVYLDSVSSNIASVSKQSDGDHIYLRLDFKESYIGGDVIPISFKVNQKDMLCKNEHGYFYEFVPGWFNAIRVEQYEFTWIVEGGKDYVQSGSLDYGEYEKLFMQYDSDAFAGCRTVSYTPFNESGAYNSLKEDRNVVMGLCFVVSALLITVEVYIIDSYVSYHRGRGFLTGYGHHLHTYGRSNPHYVRARNRHMANNRSSGSRSSGGYSRGCACACACACAGGGRAGCSQKDTFGHKK